MGLGLCTNKTDTGDPSKCSLLGSPQSSSAERGLSSLEGAAAAAHAALTLFPPDTQHGIGIQKSGFGWQYRTTAAHFAAMHPVQTRPWCLRPGQCLS